MSDDWPSCSGCVYADARGMDPGEVHVEYRCRVNAPDPTAPSPWPYVTRHDWCAQGYGVVGDDGQVRGYSEFMVRRGNE